MGGRASRESERGRGTMRYGMGRGRGAPVEGASYEPEPERGRDAPSSGPRTRRTGYAVEAGCLILQFQSF
jgi:hypothetical protein